MVFTVYIFFFQVVVNISNGREVQDELGGRSRLPGLLRTSSLLFRAVLFLELSVVMEMLLCSPSQQPLATSGSQAFEMWHI